MSSDDDWENEDSDDDKWEDDLKKKKEEPEEELTVDDIEEMKRKEAEAQAAAAPKPKKKPKDAKEEKPVNPEDLPYYVELDDPVAEKLRRQKLVEEADARLAGDLFSGLDKPDEDEEAKAKAAKEKAEKEAAEKKKAEKAKVTVVVNDAFENLELKTQEDVTNLLGTCLEKINASKAKGAAQKFFLDCLKALEPMLTGEEVRELEKSVNQMVKAKKVEKQQADAAKKKVNDTPSKNTKFNTHDEMAVVYGGDDWDDWDEDEYWEGAEAYAPPKR